jgi:hypothetical protein
MGWFLQMPDRASPKLLAKILADCGPAQEGGAAFAFASAQGVKLLAAEPAFSDFLKSSKFTIVIGLDAITDTRAVDELRKLSKSHPNFRPKLFLHEIAGSIFHPKTVWLRTPKGGIIITGSGNLTAGGLKFNWEAMAVETLTVAEMAAARTAWDAWLKTHKKELYDLDDPKVKAKAEDNVRLRMKIKRAVKGAEAGAPEDEAEIEAAAEVVDEIEQEVKLNPVLIAEIPRGSSRWEQANFDKRSFTEFFGVTIGVPHSVRFFYVQDDGSLVAEKLRPAVPVKSRNFRFELAAAKGVAYPAKGVPIGVFERISESDFQYVLLMPGDKAHTLIEKYLNADRPRTSRLLRRVQMTSGDLRKIWPDAPFFL